MTYAACALAAVRGGVSRETFEAYFVDALSRLARDGVVNVRIGVARVIREACRSGSSLLPLAVRDQVLTCCHKSCCTPTQARGIASRTSFTRSPTLTIATSRPPSLNSTSPTLPNPLPRPHGQDSIVLALRVRWERTETTIRRRPMEGSRWQGRPLDLGTESTTTITRCTTCA